MIEGEPSVVGALWVNLEFVLRRTRHSLAVDQAIREDACKGIQISVDKCISRGSEQDLKSCQTLLPIYDPPAINESPGADLFCDDRAEKVRLDRLSVVEPPIRQHLHVFPKWLPLSLLGPHVIPLVAGNCVLL